MDIGVLGSGDVGRALASGLLGEGHTVRMGSRDPGRAELVEWATRVGVELAEPAAAASFAQVAVLATAWDGTRDAVDLAGPTNLADKVVIDVTNPLRFGDHLELVVGHTDSGGEQVQRWLPDSRVVKAFNTVGHELMVHPDLDDGPGTMFVAGDDDEAKRVVAGLIGQLGWAIHDCGPLRAARYTEPMAMIWIEHAIRTGTRDHALRMLGTAAGP